jgi:hypothetical protein
MVLGATVTPARTPVICTLTSDFNPAMAVADKLSVACEPAFTDCVLGVTEDGQSGLDGGGLEQPPPLPPQAAKAITRTTH